MTLTDVGQTSLLKLRATHTGGLIGVLTKPILDNEQKLINYDKRTFHRTKTALAGNYLGRQWRLATRPINLPSQRTIFAIMIAKQSTQAAESG